jgi:hypothetical protein
MSRLLPLVIISVVTIGCVTGFLSGTQGVYASDNFTSSSNVTIDFFNPEDLQTALTNALVAQAHALEATVNQTIEEYIEAVETNQENLVTNAMLFIFCFLLTWFAFSTRSKNAGQNNDNQQSIPRGEPFLDIMAVIIDVAYGTTYASTQIIKSPAWLMGLVIAIIGTWMLISRIQLEFRIARKKRSNNRTIRR